MKPIVFRLSSLGDLILSTSFLESLPDGILVDWVVSSEFEFVLRGHPRIGKLWVYDKKTGLRGWLRLILFLSREGYDVQIDLHRTPRTRIGSLMLGILNQFYRRKVRRFSISKERIRTLMVLLLKKRIPKRWIPSPYWMRFGLLAGRIAQGGILRKPSYIPILSKSGLSENHILDSLGIAQGSYFCLMPASRWKTKEWSARSFCKLSSSLEKKGLIPVLLGREGDPACGQVKQLFEAEGVTHRSLLQEADFRVTAIVLKSAAFFVGCDTGLSHLAESVGCKTHVLFGPTRPEIGFGPCQDGSKSIGSRIGCAPCSKSGKRCYRVWSPNECMKKLLPEVVEREILS
ncbi:MAG: glycosyltransferase family 9 protein [Bdellovibrionales bacterium]|nr:glycosyltransferase family 9 protein [Bdellovibrionales bacterium]